MEVVFNDGGRAAAGFKGIANDCVVRAIAIAAGLDYRTVYEELKELCRGEKPSKSRRGKSSPRSGIHTVTYRPYLEALGFQWRPIMRIGSGCTHHLRAGELPMGRLICSCSKHVVAVIDGVVHDSHDSTRGGTRCVYGYFYLPSENDHAPETAPLVAADRAEHSRSSGVRSGPRHRRRGVERASRDRGR